MVAHISKDQKQKIYEEYKEDTTIYTEQEATKKVQLLLPRCKYIYYYNLLFLKTQRKANQISSHRRNRTLSINTLRKGKSYNAPFHSTSLKVTTVKLH